MASIFIDPGHGGRDPGEVLVQRPMLLEKDLTLAIAWSCHDRLLDHGFVVTMSRIDDSSLSLANRVAFANTVEMDAFISIHCVRSRGASCGSVRTQIWKHTQVNEPFGRAVHQSLIEHLPGVKDQGFVGSRPCILEHTDMAAALVEWGCPEGRSRAKLMRDDVIMLGEAIAMGIISYFRRSGGRRTVPG